MTKAKKPIAPKPVQAQRSFMKGKAPARSALGTLLDRLDHYLDGTELFDTGSGGTDLVFELMQSEVHARYFAAKTAEARGDEAEARRMLPQLRASIDRALALCDMNDGRWPLLRVSLNLIDEFGGPAPESMPQPRPTRPSLPDTALQAACFISRLSAHLSELDASGQAIDGNDLLAIHQAASVILSADGGDPEDYLERTLQEAMHTATVVLTAQPPKSTGLVPVEEGPVITKKQLVRALS